jgi:chemotaxis methyl-accepting protein methylase
MWEAVRATVRAHTGLTLPTTMKSVIARALDHLAIRDPGELTIAAVRERFFDHVFIGTTWFAREQAGIDALVRALVPVARSRADGSVHVWSAGCSMGQEAYTLAMALTDAGCRPRVLATDFHQPSLRMAREGCYSGARIPDHWRRRYFEPDQTGAYRVVRSLRDCVRFERHNFATDPPLVTQLDAVVCRNVLIYFERADAIAALARLASACRTGGFLLLGALEAPLLWMSVNDPRFGASAVPLVQLSARSPLHAPAAAPVLPPQRIAALPRRPNSETQSALARARALERAGQLQDALRVLDRPAATAPLDATAHLARGLVLKQMGRIDEAIQELRAARFLDPESWLAPYQLAACLERIGESEEALEAYRHTAAAIDNGGRSGMVPYDESIEVLAATTAAACRRKLGARARTQPPVE